MNPNEISGWPDALSNRLHIPIGKRTFKPCAAPWWPRRAGSGSPMRFAKAGVDALESLKSKIGCLSQVFYSVVLLFKASISEAAWPPGAPPRATSIPHLSLR
jgi:hypothetical protein